MTKKKYINFSKITNNLIKNKSVDYNQLKYLPEPDEIKNKKLLFVNGKNQFEKERSCFISNLELLNMRGLSKNLEKITDFKDSI